MDKYKLLHHLKDTMEADDNLPLKNENTKLVFGSGNTNAQILICGEAPGVKENLLGLPFVGQSGKLLDKLLILAGLERKKVFITNIVHHRPPENRDPLPNEIEAYGKYLDQIINIIKPKIIITLGRFSMNKFLPDAKISEVHGKSFNINWGDPLEGNSLKLMVIPMYHPAASLRNGKILEAEKLDFMEIKDVIQSI